MHIQIPFCTILLLIILIYFLYFYISADGTLEHLTLAEEEESSGSIVIALAALNAQIGTLKSEIVENTQQIKTLQPIVSSTQSELQDMVSDFAALSEELEESDSSKKK